MITNYLILIIFVVVFMEDPTTYFRKGTLTAGRILRSWNTIVIPTVAGWLYIHEQHVNYTKTCITL